MLLGEVGHRRGPTIVRLDDWLSLRARTHPDRIAVEAADATLSYAELEGRVGGIAGGLAALGLGSDDRVGLALAPSADFVVGLHAIGRIGAVAVALDPRMTSAERAERERAAATVMVLDELPHPAGASLDVTPADRVAIQTVIFTSGTTGEPKPVELTYANHAASALAAVWNVGLDPDDRWLSALPLFHIGGLAIVVRAAIYGTTAVIHERFEPDRVIDAFERRAVTLCSLVPTMLRRLREAGMGSAPDLRACLLGGAPVPGDLLDWARAAALPIVPTYGMTETASQVATLTPAEALAGLRGARPLIGVEFETSPEDELLVRGPMVAPGEIAQDGWLHTGDLGRVDGNGLLQIEGRLKDVIVTGGENVGPAEVEQALLSHPAVADAAVLGVPDPEWGEAIVALVILRNPAEDAELLAHCHERISRYKVPKRIERVEQLPRNAAGKLLRTQLRIPDR